MEIKYNASGSDKKTLVKAVSDIIGERQNILARDIRICGRRPLHNHERRKS